MQLSMMNTPSEIDEVAASKRIRTARRLAGLSQREAAIQLDVTEKTVARWESAETFGFLGELDRIAKVYGTTPEALLGTDGSTAEEAVAAQLGALRSELDELRALLLDPKKLRQAADALIEDERPRRRRKR